MNTVEQPIQPAERPRQSNKLCYILIAAMLAYGTVFLVLSFCSPSLKQVIFVSQIINAAAFFLALVAFIKARGRG
ncbi:MAG: hypothetical protein ACREFE_13250 [Limisphaerales bacterium]